MNIEINHSPSVLIRIFFIVIILAVAAAGFIGLKKMKKPPVQKPIKERVLAVNTLVAEPKNQQVVLSGYGEIATKTTVPLSAEVAGRITNIFPHLDSGITVSKGTVLFTIDDQDYKLDLATAQARLKILQRDYTLAQKEFDRVSSLYRDKKVGTLSSMEQAEKALNSIANQLRQVEQARDMAALKIKRCTVKAPFDGRVTDVSAEKDEYVNVGRELITLVNDGALEILVALDSRDAARWLKIRDKQPGSQTNWFGQPAPVDCTIIWSEDEMITGTGQLERIVRFDNQTRTLVVAIAMQADAHSAFPLSEGMFCRVEIPGRELTGVVQLPRQAVTFENTVYIVRDDRLQTTTVSVARMAGDHAFINDGLQPGDKVIVTRLENPLENSLIKVINQEKK